MELEEKIIEALKEGFICDSCLGRIIGNLLSGFSNEERGRTLRHYVAFLIDSGEKVDVDLSNFYGIRFRNVKLEVKKPGKCKICKNFFPEQIDRIARNVMKELKGIEFRTFLIGSVPTDEMLKAEEKLYERTGIDFVEPIKSEINREIGKRIERGMKKLFSQKNPDVTVIVNLKTGKVRKEVRSLYVFGKYKKLVRGIPQTRWVCSNCRGKGCVKCKGSGKLYPTSIQEIVEKPLLKAAKAKKSAFHAAGREDIDARCLDYRPFVIELVKPLRRRMELAKAAKEINRSKKVSVGGLKLSTKEMVLRLKTERIDKSYVAEVEFEKRIDRKRLKELKRLESEPVLQKTPLRVVHRRADKFRKRLVKKISWKLLGSKRMILRVRAESGLYIKELVSGDDGRTRPSVAELIINKPKKIKLDVVKIHRRG